MDPLFKWFNLGFVLGLLLFLAVMALFFKRSGELLGKENRGHRGTLMTSGAMGALLSSYIAAYVAVSFGGVLGGGIGDALAGSFPLSSEMRSAVATTGAVLGIALVFGVSLVLGAFALMMLNLSASRKSGNW